MVTAIPAAIIFVNNDLIDQVRAVITTQLHIDEWINGAEFDARVSSDPTYPSSIHQLNRRLMVERDFRDHTNRELADVVIFVKAGMAAIEQNKFGPPGCSHRVLNLYWGQLGVYSPP